MTTTPTDLKMNSRILPELNKQLFIFKKLQPSGRRTARLDTSHRYTSL